MQKAEDQLGGGEEAEEGEDLCDCEFSLAYGAKILLNNAKLHLKRGKLYGLCGPNGAGKVRPYGVLPLILPRALHRCLFQLVHCHVPQRLSCS